MDESDGKNLAYCLKKYFERFINDNSFYFFLRFNSESLFSLPLGRYRRNLPLKINYSCIGIKVCDSTTPVKVCYVFTPGNL